ncbi:uncharacterized protein ACWYII_015170 [Salvelinus alpinus]
MGPEKDKVIPERVYLSIIMVPVGPQREGESEGGEIMRVHAASVEFTNASPCGGPILPDAPSLLPLCSRATHNHKQSRREGHKCLLSEGPASESQPRVRVWYTSAASGQTALQNGVLRILKEPDSITSPEQYQHRYPRQQPSPSNHLFPQE